MKATASRVRLALARFLCDSAEMSQSRQRVLCCDIAFPPCVEIAQDREGFQKNVPLSPDVNMPQRSIEQLQVAFCAQPTRGDRDTIHELAHETLRRCPEFGDLCLNPDSYAGNYRRSKVREDYLSEDIPQLTRDRVTKPATELSLQELRAMPTDLVYARFYRAARQICHENLQQRRNHRPPIGDDEPNVQYPVAMSSFRRNEARERELMWWLAAWVRKGFTQGSHFTCNDQHSRAIRETIQVLRVNLGVDVELPREVVDLARLVVSLANNEAQTCRIFVHLGPNHGEPAPRAYDGLLARIQQEFAFGDRDTIRDMICVLKDGTEFLVHDDESVTRLLLQDGPDIPHAVEHLHLAPLNDHDNPLAPAYIRDPAVRVAGNPPGQVRFNRRAQEQRRLADRVRTLCYPDAYNRHQGPPQRIQTLVGGAEELSGTAVGSARADMDELRPVEELDPLIMQLRSSTPA